MNVAELQFREGSVPPSFARVLSPARAARQAGRQAVRQAGQADRKAVQQAVAELGRR